jgi:hypothetical protein
MRSSVRYGRKLTLVALVAGLVVLVPVASHAGPIKNNTQVRGGGSWRAPDVGLWRADQSTGGFSGQNQSVNGLDACTLSYRYGYRDCKSPASLAMPPAGRSACVTSTNVSQRVIDNVGRRPSCGRLRQVRHPNRLYEPTQLGGCDGSERDQSEPQLIVTVRGIGCMFDEHQLGS